MKKTVEQSKSVYKAVQVGASRLWWNRFVEKVSFEPGMKHHYATGTRVLLRQQLVTSIEEVIFLPVCISQQDNSKVVDEF